MNEEAAPARNGARFGLAFTTLALLWAAFLHHGMGPSFRSDSWIEPSSFLWGEVPDALAGALAVLVLPCLALAIAIGFVTRSSLARTLAGFATIASACFVFYGIEADRVWRFFHWRWSVSLVLFSAVIALAAYAPLLAASWRRMGWPRGLAVYLPLFASLVAFERNVTGTNPGLPLAISPWPVVQIGGLEVFASLIAVLEIGVALGLAGLARGLGAGLAGIVASVAVPSAFLAAGSASALLPFQVGPRLYAAMAVASALTLAAAAFWPPRDAAAHRRRARNFLLGGALAALPLVTGQALTRLDYSVTRDERAQSVIDALAEFRSRNGIYPDALSELVDAQLLPDVPRPRIGFASAQDFTYQNFGESYLLEFSAPRWIQCAYNPPYDPIPGEEPEADEDAGGAWSCPQKPPELW